MRRLYLLVFLIFLFNFFAHAQVFVKFNATGANNGSSWVNAYTNLDSAINHTANGQIWVSAGTYKPSLLFMGYLPYKAFHINKPIALLGGFSGIETNINQRNINSNVTILTGDTGIPGNDTDNTPRVVIISGANLDSSTAVDGFTITKAHYETGMGYTFDNGGVYILGSGKPLLRNCTIAGNSGYDGAGIYVNSGNAIITDNTIINNIAYEGAGIYTGAASPTIINNRIMFNSCPVNLSNLAGGGIYVGSYGSPDIIGNLIEGNYAAHYGGGICHQGNFPLNIYNNIISNNSSREGAGIYSNSSKVNIVNNLIVNNHASNYGGGVFGDYTIFNLTNNTIVNNTAGLTGAATYLSSVSMNAVNNIIYGNHANSGKSIAVLMGPATMIPKFYYCDIEDGTNSIDIINNSISIDSIWRTGNITQIPNFIDTAAYNFHLNPVSACVDQGIVDTAGLNLPVNDISGNPRIYNTRIDMGCYEYSGGSGNEVYLSLNPDSVNLAGWHDSTFNLGIFSNINWHIYNNTAWLNISNLQGSGNGSVPVSVPANPSLTDKRVARSFVSAAVTNIPSVPFTVSQSDGGYFFIPDTLYINGNVNDTASFTINSNLIWYIDSSPSWLQFNISGGQTGQTVSVKVTAANATNNVRQGIIAIHYGNTLPGITKNIVVMQATAAAKLCPGGSTTFTAGLSGTTYKWQVDTGIGFTPLSDNTTYTGTNTSILHLNNLPSSFYGYRYRCLVENLIYSNIFSIQFENKWTGSVSSVWENPLNWSCSVVPDSNTDVVIFSGTVIISVSTTIRKLTANSFANIIVQQGANLTILH